MEILYAMWLVTAVNIYYQEACDTKLIEPSFKIVSLITTIAVLIMFGADLFLPPIFAKLIALCGFIAVHMQLPTLLVSRSMFLKYSEHEFEHNYYCKRDRE